MLKKIIIFLSIIFINLFSINIIFAECSYNWWDISSAIEWCVGSEDMWLVKADWDMDVAKWFKEKILFWNDKIATFLALGAIFAVVFGSLKMVLSAGEEEKIKKSKEIVKWWLIWLLVVASAWFLVSVVVKVIYSVGNV